MRRRAAVGAKPVQGPPADSFTAGKRRSSRRYSRAEHTRTFQSGNMTDRGGGQWRKRGNQDQAGNGNKKRKYFSGAGNSGLSQGSRGVLVSCIGGKEQQAAHEASRLLQEVCATHNWPSADTRLLDGLTIALQHRWYVLVGSTMTQPCRSRPRLQHQLLEPI